MKINFLDPHRSKITFKQKQKQKQIQKQEETNFIKPFIFPFFGLSICVAFFIYYFNIHIT
jgi:membrane protein insertase Oxa1/YidC/SpoIIIJ